MKFLSSVGFGLSVVFCCLLLALIAETYYLLWWKRRIAGRDKLDIFYILCWKSKKNLPSSSLTSTTLSFNAHQSETEDLYLKAIDENCIETGFMMGPPRFLFTIKEETKEELELEESRLKGESRRLSDLMRKEDSPYITPISSPTFFTPPLTPSMASSHSRSSSIGYNPFYESTTDIEFNMIRSSPPPKFKFLRDAEEKLWKKISMEPSSQVLPLAF